jgi:ribosomal small subunit protein bTHX
MGRGDRKSRQGKIWAGSHGKRRPKAVRRSKTMKNARPSAKHAPKPAAAAKSAAS